MMTITREQILAICSDPLLGPAAMARLSDPEVSRRPSASLTDSEWDDLHDSCLETLMNDAPIVESFEAEQSKGTYTVSIRGVPSAYFVTAPEFDSDGVFSTLDDARDHADSEHGEFRVREGDVEGDEEEEWVEPDPYDPVFPDSLLSVLAGTDEPESVARLRRSIVADANLVLLANGSNAPQGMECAGDASELVSSFEDSLPKPQGAIDGMSRMMMKLPRLRLRVELFKRVNGRLPDPRETSDLYDLQ